MGVRHKVIPRGGGNEEKFLSAVGGKTAYRSNSCLVSANE